MFTKHLHHHNALVATPPPGFEPGTNRLTVDSSTAELQRNRGSEDPRLFKQETYDKLLAFPFQHAQVVLDEHQTQSYHLHA